MEPALVLLVFCLGAFAGSFLNVVIHRAPAMWGLIDPSEDRGDLLKPGSYCPACKAPLPAWRLIPLLSYAFQRGRCAYCHTAIAPRYPVVEILGGGVALCAFALFGLTPPALLAAIFGWALIGLAAIDLETGYLPDWITLPLIILGLIANAFDSFVPLPAALIGATAGYLAFRLIGEVFLRLRQKEGLGQGDAKLIAAIGAFIGWSGLPVVVLLASLGTLVCALLRNLSKQEALTEQELAFGPGLAAAGFAGMILLGLSS